MINKRLLKNGLDGLYADRVYEIERRSILIYAESYEVKEIQSYLDQLAELGKIEIIKPLDECEEMDKCIRLLGWLNPRRPDGQANS